MKGVPLRLEIGPRDIENNQCVLVRRDNREKVFVNLDDLDKTVEKMLQDLQQDLFDKALKHRDENTFVAKTLEEFEGILKEKQGFIKAMWCEDRECEEKIKELTGATSRCMPFEQENIANTCICCGKPAKKMVYWAKAY